MKAHRASRHRIPARRFAVRRKDFQTIHQELRGPWETEQSDKDAERESAHDEGAAEKSPRAELGAGLGEDVSHLGDLNRLNVPLPGERSSRMPTAFVGNQSEANYIACRGKERCHMVHGSERIGDGKDERRKADTNPTTSGRSFA